MAGELKQIVDHYIARKALSVRLVNVNCAGP